MKSPKITNLIMGGTYRCRGGGDLSLWPENLKAAVESQLSLFSVTNNMALMCSQNIQTVFVLHEGRCSLHAVNFIGIDLAHVSCRHSSLWSCLGFLPLLEPQTLASSRFP